MVTHGQVRLLPVDDGGWRGKNIGNVSLVLNAVHAHNAMAIWRREKRICLAEANLENVRLCSVPL